jgi:dTDP-glucose 4,6-dehydratase
VLERGAEVCTLDKLTYSGGTDNLADVRDCATHRFHQVDICDATALSTTINDFAPDAIMHLAAETHVDRSIDGPRPFIDTNVVGTFVLLEVARAYEASLPADERARFRFLHVSTDEVYGSLGPTGLFAEHSPYAPHSPYAASKAAADHLARAYFHTYGLPVIVTNCSNNYGPRQFPEKLIPLMVLTALAGRPLPIYGDGGHVRDWLHVVDHCAGLLLVLSEGRVGESYNIGGSCERTNLQVVDSLCDALEALLPAAANPALRGTGSYRALKTFVPDRPGHDRRYAIDATKVREELGWRPSRTFEAGLRETVQWYVEHRDWCEQVSAGRYGGERLGLGARLA